MDKIFKAINAYAAAYLRLEEIQKSNQSKMPRGDQKTGVIAEVYARVYAEYRFSGAKVRFGTTTEHAWDIRVTQRPLIDCLVQVKAVSAHSTTRRVSPIHPGWHELWLMSLDQHLLPEAFWVILASDVDWSKQTMNYLSMPKANDPRSGSTALRGGKDEFADLRKALMTEGLKFPTRTIPRSLKRR